MSSAIAGLIDNNIDLTATATFAAILGANPSQGARSPLLWNAAFAAHGADCRMLPMDVSADNLAALLDALDAEPQFIGGAIAVPHKESIARWLGRAVTDEAAAIGAVNCLYRVDGHLVGTNTDGEGALTSLRQAKPDLPDARVLMLGCGGAGKAVAAFIIRAVGQVTLSVRCPDALAAFAERIGASVAPWPPTSAAIGEAEVIINTTVVGSNSPTLITKSPLADLAAAKPDALVFDIIYDPGPTELLKLATARGLATLSGEVMNLEQAVIAFARAAEQPNGPKATRKAMAAARTN